jgi:hypothetical protein
MVKLEDMSRLFFDLEMNRIIHHFEGFKGEILLSERNSLINGLINDYHLKSSQMAYLSKALVQEESLDIT